MDLQINARKLRWSRHKLSKAALERQLQSSGQCTRRRLRRTLWRTVKEEAGVASSNPYAPTEGAKGYKPSEPILLWSSGSFAG